ncbi:MAG: FAD-binding oxidoreductase [Burkholderiales bacterium]
MPRTTRRMLLKQAAAISLLPFVPLPLTGVAHGAANAAGSAFRRSRPGDRTWPSAAEWDRLNQAVGGQLSRVESPLMTCATAPGGTACNELFRNMKNPYFIGDSPALTQTVGWVDGWSSAPSVYALAARTTADVVAAVNFAREHRLRLVIKGGGHSYQGTSNGPDSLLVWTRPMNAITLHDAFIGAGCAGKVPPQPAVSVGAGAIWLNTYHAVTSAGRYVQGGGCATVGVAGLVQSGGFGSFSKYYGMAAAGLLEAEIVTADGVARIVNACMHPDLYRGLKGGGGGSLGVVTRLTLRTRELPAFLGGAQASIKAASDAAYRRLIARFVVFYADSLLNPRWGEMAKFRPGNVLEIAMVFHGLSQPEAAAIWRPFFEWIAASPQDYSLASPLQVIAVPARNFWDPEYLRRNLPQTVVADSRPGAPAHNLFWAGNLGEAGQYLHGYDSTWLPVSLLKKDQQKRLVDALFASSRHWQTSLHFNKGMAGAPAEAVASARQTVTHPAVADAFALAICAGGGPPAFASVPGHEPDLARARADAKLIGLAMRELVKVAPNGGSYVSEGNYFNRNWQQAYWGSNYQRLLAVKRKYDPDGLFFVHHGVGSEDWSADGFTRIAGR